MMKLPVYFVVDLSGSMDGFWQERVRNALNEFAEIVHQTPVLWECKIWASVVTLGCDIVQLLPLSDGTSFEAPDLQFETSESPVKDFGALRRIVERDLDVDVTDRKALWKRKIHAPVAVVFSTNVQRDWEALSSIFWRTDLILLSRNSESPTEMELYEPLSQDFIDGRPWDGESGLGQELRHWIELELDMEADCVPEWMEEGWNEEDEFSKPTTKENSEMMTCPKCSHEFDDSESACPCCGWSPHTRLLLVGSAGTRSFGGRFSVGRPLLRSICGEEDARFADSAEQFVLELSEDQKWSVIPGTGKNPTFLNGKRIVSQTMLNTNDILSIGVYRARMSVSID